ncbi:MAG: hypothetical protein ACYTGG_05505 [Planctomycetota bacterium]|jgi:hypothetical protein
MNDDLTTDEIAILESLIGGDPNEPIYRSQIAGSRIKREWTGVGFFVDFVDSTSMERAPIPGRKTLDGTGRMSGIDVGFILFVDDGRTTMLECYTYGGERLPEDSRLQHVDRFVAGYPWRDDGP